jgi:dipeptidyl aminopeptidase/acylaminoacyl peptidase
MRLSSAARKCRSRCHLWIAVHIFCAIAYVISGQALTSGATRQFLDGHLPSNANMAERLTHNVLNLAIPCHPKLSPDGRNVVYGTRRKLNHDGGGAGTSIWIASSTSERSARPLTSGANFDSQPKWSPDGTSVAFISRRVEAPGSCTLYLVQPQADPQPKAITPPQHRERITKYQFRPDGKAIAFLARPERSPEREAKERENVAIVWGQDWVYTHLWLTTVATGAVEPLFKQHANVVDFAWNANGTRISFITHRTPDIESKFLHGADIHILDCDSGDVQTVYHVPGGMWDLRSLIWSGASLYFLSCHELAGDTSGLAIYSIGPLDSEKPSELETIGFDEEACPDSLLVVGDDIVVYVQNRMEDQLRLLHNGQVLFRQQKRIVDFDVVRRPTDGQLLQVIVSGDVNNPSEAISIDAEGHRIQLSDHGAACGLSGQTFGFCSFVACSTLDRRETLHGLYLTPAQLAGHNGKPTSPLPTFVYMHGGPYARCADSFDSFCALHTFIPVYLREGFGVLLVNYRGGSGHGRRFASYAQAGAGIFDEPDVVALTQHAIHSGLADPERLVAGGWSQGGHLAYLCAVRNGAHSLGWRFRAVVAGAGITDWAAATLESDAGFFQAQLGCGAPWREGSAGVEGQQRRGAIWEFADALRDKRIPPMLILHGENDARTPVAQARGFRRALEEAGLPFEFVTYPREGHHFRERKHLEDLQKRLLLFLRAHLA